MPRVREIDGHPLTIVSMTAQLQCAGFLRIQDIDCLAHFAFPFRTASLTVPCSGHLARAIIVVISDTNSG